MAGWLGGLPPLALATVAYHHLFLVLAQLENYVTDHSLLGKGVGSFARLILNILFWQLEPLLFSVSLGALAVVVGAHQSTYRNAWIRILFFCGVVGSTAYVVVDQVRALDDGLGLPRLLACAPPTGVVSMGCLQSPPIHCCESFFATPLLSPKCVLCRNFERNDHNLFRRPSHILSHLRANVWLSLWCATSN